METLESQVAKIQIGNFKQTSSFVLTFAEKAPEPECELYAVVELPLFNPAAVSDCERIAQALTSTFKRAYRRGLTDGTFEAALGEINEELGKLATLGQTNWIGKLNAAVATKAGSLFTIATTGKVTALLFREGEFTDITDSPKVRHPLKTFENYATGKLKAEDLLVLSTAELFNHISIDRLKNIIKNNALNLAAENLVKVLEENAGPEVAFGTLLMYQARPQMEAADESINLEEYLPKNRSVRALFSGVHKAAKGVLTHHAVKSGFAKAKSLVTKKPSINVTSMMENSKKNMSGLAAKSRMLAESNMQKFSGLSRQKKIFVISAAVLAVAVVVNIFVARNLKENKQDDSVFRQTFSEAQTLLNQADGSMLYEDNETARRQLLEATAKLQSLTDLSDAQKAELEPLNAQAAELNSKLNKVTTLNVINLGSLSAGENLIVLPERLATETNGNIVSYNKQSQIVEDGVLKTGGGIKLSAQAKGATAVVYDGQGLAVWDFAKGTTTEGFYQNVPGPADIAGLSYYSTNERAYIIDTAKAQIINFAVGSTGVGSATVWSKSAPELSNSLDMAIDGNIYVLHPNGVNKYTKGLAAEFSFPALPTPLSGKGKIYTDKDIQNIYVLDSGNKRILVVSKTGNLENILQSNDLTSPTDFTVDEASKTIYILNNGSLLKATY